MTMSTNVNMNAPVIADKTKNKLYYEYDMIHMYLLFQIALCYQQYLSQTGMGCHIDLKPKPHVEF